MNKTTRTIDCKPRDMYEEESMKRLVEGLKLSASCAWELHAMMPKDGWDVCCKALRHLIVQCQKLNEAKALTKQALLADADRIQGMLGPRTD